MHIDLRSDIKATARQLRWVHRDAVPQAAARALNRTAQQVQSAAAKELAAETGLKQKDIREALSRARATWRRLVSAVIATGHAVNLIRFTRQTREQARKTGGVRANAWGRRRLYKGTFIGNKGRTVFRRVAGKFMPSRKGETKHSQAIEPVHGPSIPREMARKKLQSLLRRVVDVRWPKNFAQDLRYYLSRRPR